MQVLSLKIENILSIEKAEISFSNSGLVLVEGWNFDDGRANGAGKTAIFNAMSFALYGKLPRKVTASEILRKGSKSGFAEITIQTGDGEYTVRRERPKNLLFKKDSQPISITQSEFEDTIRLSYDQFLVSMYTAQQYGGKFINLNDVAKKDFLLQLMNLNEFAACKKEADKSAKELQIKKDEEILKIEKAKSKIEVYKDSIVNLPNLKQLLSQCVDDIEAVRQDIKQLSTVAKPDVSKFDALEMQIRDKLKSLSELRFTRNSLYNEFHATSSQITSFVPTEPDAECPHCFEGLKIHGKSVSKPDDVEAHKRAHEEHINGLRDKASSLKVQIDNLDLKLSEEKSIRELLDKSIKRKEKEMSLYNSASQEAQFRYQSLQNLEMRKSDTESQIKQLSEMQGKIDVLQQYINNANDAVAALSQEIEVYQTVSSMYSSTGAPAYIMDSVVDSFNEIVADYIALVWPNATYELQSYKEKKSGDVAAKFSEMLMINGKQRSIGSLSGGEARALSLAVDFAVIDILSQQFNIPINPIVMDEPFEGLDATGREIVIDLLNKLSSERQIWVIDHASEVKSMFSQIIRVEKRNGVSCLVS